MTDLATVPVKVRWDPKVLRLEMISPGALLTQDGKIMAPSLDIRNDTGDASIERKPGSRSRRSERHRSAVAAHVYSRGQRNCHGKRDGSPAEEFEPAADRGAAAVGFRHRAIRLMMRRKTQGGLTLVELIVAFTIMMVLTTMAVPLARYKVQRDKERDLEQRAARDPERDR